MHIEDWDPRFLERFDPQKYFRLLKTANVDAVMLYTQAHTGLCYWPTKSGKMHNAFVDREDAMKQVFQLCSKDGMKTIAYYSLIYNNWAYDEHIAWRMINPHGMTSRQTGGRYGLCCPNNMEYRDFIKEQVKEIFAYFPAFEGFFYDMTFWPMVCHCNSCKERWRKEVGGELPEEINWKDERWLLFQKKREEWLGEFARFTTDVVKEQDLDCSVEHQYGNAFLDFWRRGVTENVALASDYIGTDLSGGIDQQSFACKAWYNLTMNQPFQYMNLPQLFNRTTIKSIEQLRRFVMTVYAHHGACLYIDDIKPDGQLNEQVYERIGNIYKEAERYEPYIKQGEMAYDIALYLNLRGKMDLERNQIPLRSAEAKKNNVPHVEAVRGASTSLRANHLPFGVVNRRQLDQLDSYKVMVLSDTAGLEDDELDRIDRYVLNGGALYMSGHSAPSLVEKYFSIRQKGISEETATFLLPEGSNVFGEFDSSHPLAVMESALLFEGEARGEILATVMLPYTVPNPMGMFGQNDGSEVISQKDTHRYRFVSIHDDPAFVRTDYPAIIKAQVGKGTVIWSAFPLEKFSLFPYGNLFAELIKGLAGDDLKFGADAHSSVECVLFEDSKNKMKLMSVLNMQEDAVPMPAVDVSVWIKTDSCPEAVVILPDEKPVEYSYDGAYVRFKLDRVEQCVILAVK